MTTKIGKSLQSLVQDFFLQHLAIERNVSNNTIASYRDVMKLFLRHASDVKASPAEQLDHSALDVETVRSFLRWVQTERGCSPRTCNQRLAGLKSFARYVASVAPEHLERCRLIREIPPLRIEHPEAQYLVEDEVVQVVAAPDASTPIGRRDRALFLLLYNTGARVQEIVDLNIGDTESHPIPFVRLQGKGRKQRTCPLWSRTAVAIQHMLGDRRNVDATQPLFLSARGQRLSRSGIAYLLNRAEKHCLLRPQHAKRLSPHVIRHTTAMHLLQSGVDITTIAAWLGHEQLDTTHGYVQVDLRMKQAAIAADNALPETRDGEYPSPDIIDWLEDLARGPSYVELARPCTLSRPGRRRGCT